jgi:hypothetical protein
MRTDFLGEFRDCVFQVGPGAVEAGGMRDALFQLFFMIAGAYGGIRVVDDVKWVRERKLARAGSN